MTKRRAVRRALDASRGRARVFAQRSRLLYQATFGSIRSTCLMVGVSLERTVKVRLFHAQARRIHCEHCGRPYSWIDAGVKTGKVKTKVVFADGSELRREAFRKAADSLAERAEEAHAGKGRCPHCHQLQTWMIVTAIEAVIASVVGALVVAAASAFIAYHVASPTMAIYVGGGAAAIGVLAALILGPRLADEPGPRPDLEDERGKTDEELLVWLRANHRGGDDPILAWGKSTSKTEPHKATEVSLGLLDRGDPPLEIAESLTSAACARRLSAMDG